MEGESLNGNMGEYGKGLNFNLTIRGFREGK